MVTFKEKMNMYDKESLKVFAADLFLRNVSQLKKADLIEKITEAFLNPESMFYRLSLLDDKAINLLKSASKTPVQFPLDDVSFDMACTLNEMELGAIDENKGFSTLTDVWHICEKKLADEEFEAYRKKASWVWKCLRWTEYMYGYTPEDVFLKLVNTKKKMDIDLEELREIFDHFPEDVMYTLRFEDGFFARYLLDKKDTSDALRRAQGDKEFYIPKVEEVEEFFYTGALLSHKPYQEMLKFLVNDIKMGKKEAVDLLYDLWDKLTLDDDPHETMQWFWDQFEFVNEAQVNRIVSLYMPISNGTNLLINRGYTPSDLPRPKLKPGQMPTIFPGSSKAAEMLAEAMPGLQKMGFGVDLDSNATKTGQKKIYPNDPCPCGSGKKYKKCCGIKR